MCSRSGLAVSKVSLEQVCEPALCAHNSLGTCVWHASVARQLSKGGPATASAADILTVARGRYHVKQPERGTLNSACLSGAHKQV